jgi:activator of 2-hydroxyglutaryl-CoA dehydratase
MQQFALGLDIGSISVNTVLIDDSRNIIEDHYTLCHGRPFHALHEILTDL